MFQKIEAMMLLFGSEFLMCQVRLYPIYDNVRWYIDDRIKGKFQNVIKESLETAEDT
jgi:hypothetical protein